MCVTQHVTDLSGKETMARVTGMVPLPLFCSFCDWGVHDFLWPVKTLIVKHSDFSLVIRSVGV
jgi:hypothetical protein